MRISELAVLAIYFQILFLCYSKLKVFPPAAIFFVPFLRGDPTLLK
jgi:hypothetical protein